MSHDVLDILKPTYNFGGLSLAQMTKPYVDNWLRTRQSVSDQINAFSVVALSTNMVSYQQFQALSLLVSMNERVANNAISVGSNQDCGVW